MRKKDAKIEETLTSDSKGKENLAVTTNSSPGVSSKDKSKLASEAQIQNMGSDGSVEKTSKTFQPKKESADAGKRATVPVSKNLAQSAVPKISPVTSHESGKGETASATSSQSKQDEEKSVVSSSSIRPSLEENILLGVALEGSK